jgi:hypothetical protein
MENQFLKKITPMEKERNGYFVVIDAIAGSYPKEKEGQHK